MRTLVALALVVVACGRSDQRDRPAVHDAPSATPSRGPDPVVLRVPRKGGPARVYTFARLDSAIWTSAKPVPSPDHVLAFDDDAGMIAFVDTRGLPGRINLRLGDVSRATTAKLTSLGSADGSAIYGIASQGVVTRLTPTGSWTFKPPAAARQLLPQPDGALLVLTEHGGPSTTIWLLRPPDTKIADTAVVPRSERAFRTQVGDRVYFAVDSGLVGVRGRDLAPVRPIRLKHRVRALAPTPSGDRLYLSMDSTRGLSVVDRYTEKVSGTLELPGEVSDLRMDPLGRYVLARAAIGDSAWVIAIGTDRVIGTVRTAWTQDLPFAAPDGSLALLVGKDVQFVDGETLRPRQTVVGGARDFWYPFAWDGFRPRAAELDQPVTFGEPADSARDTLSSGQTVDSAFATAPAARDSARPVRPRVDTSVAPVGAPSSAPSPAPSQPTPATKVQGFTVQFAAVVDERKARSTAAAIRAGAEAPRVVATRSGGSTIYRVVLGPYPTRPDAERVGRAAHHDFWVYEGIP